MPLIRPHRFDVSIDRNEDVLELARSFAGMTHATLTHGNAATIVQDDAFFDALVADFATARSSIHIENYLWKPGRTFDRVAEALETASRRGVEVRVIYDGVGAIGESEDRIEQLCDAGCSVAIGGRPHAKFVVYGCDASRIARHQASLPMTRS